MGGGGSAEGEFRTAKTSVWWDIENCQVPKGWDAHTVAKNISTALANMGYKGMVSVSAYGDTSQIAPAVQQALSSTGVSLNHVPSGVKDASDKKILVDMLFWAVDNPPPANYLLISGDRDFSNALHQLGMRRYNILLAHAPNVSQALVAAAKCVWLWTSLLAGGLPLNNESSQNFISKTSSIPIFEPRQPVDPPENTQSNQKGYANGKYDKRYKGKQTSTCSNSSKHSIAVTDELNNGSSDRVLKSNQMLQPKQDLTLAKTSQPLESMHPISIENSLAPSVPFKFPSDSGNESSQNTNSETSRAPIEPRQPVSPEKNQSNQNGYSNGKSDKRFKGKQTSSSANSSNHFSVVADELNNGSSDMVLQSNQMQQPKQVHTLAKTFQPLESMQVDNIGNSLATSVPFKFPFVPGNESSQNLNSETSRFPIFEPRQQVNPPEKSQSNQKGNANVKSDKRSKGKQTSTSADSSKHSSAVTDELNIGSSVKDLKSNQMQQQKQVPAYLAKSSQPLESMQVGNIEISLTQFPSDPGNESSNNSISEISGISISEPRQPVNPPDNIQSNQKGYANDKSDKQFKGKQTSTTSNSLKHSSAVTDELSSGSSDKVLKSNQMKQPKQVLTSLAQTSQPPESVPVNNIENSLAAPSVLFKFPSGPGSESSHNPNSETSRIPIFESQQPVNPPENNQSNQKEYTSSKSNELFKGKQTVTSANSSSHSIIVTDELNNGSSDKVLKSNQMQQPMQIFTSLESMEVHITENSLDPSVPFKFPSDPGNVSSQNSNSETSRIPIFEPRQPVNPPENNQSNQKGYAKGKYDKRSKGKQTWTSANNSKHSSAVTDELNSGSSDKVLKSNQMQQPKQVLAYLTKSSQPLENMQVNNIENSLALPVPFKFPSDPGNESSQNSISKASRMTKFETRQPMNPPQGTGSIPKGNTNGKFDKRFKGKQTSLSANNIKHSSVVTDELKSESSDKVLKSNQMQQPKQVLTSLAQTSQQPENMQVNYSQTSGNSDEHGYLKDVSNQQPSKRDGPTPFNSSPSTTPPDTNRLNFSDYPQGVNNTSYYQNSDPPSVASNPLSSVTNVCLPPNFAPSFHHRPELMPPPAPVNGNAYNNGSWGILGCPQSSSVVQFLIRNILHALCILETDQIMPTEANIADCIHYGETNLPNFNVSLGIDLAIRHNMIVKHGFGASLSLYVGKNDKLWKCVNITNCNYKHSKKKWNAIQTFITSPSGRAAIMATQCRYQAAIILRKNCLKNQVMGNVLRILNSSIHTKKWIEPHSSGWQPLSIKLPVSVDTDIKLVA